MNSFSRKTPSPPLLDPESPPEESPDESPPPEDESEPPSLAEDSPESPLPESCDVLDEVESFPSVEVSGELSPAGKSDDPSSFEGRFESSVETSTEPPSSTDCSDEPFPSS